jgi:hypothetical protein
MRDIASDPEIANRFRGNGVFDEFAKTGGYSDRDISNIRTRANSVIPAYYDVARNEASRMGNVQGGYGPGQAALFARMGRDQARGAAGTALDTEVGIKDKVNEGRRWGSGQVSAAEGNLQNARMNALTGATSAFGNMTNSIAQNRIGAANAGAGNETGMQGVIQKGKMFGTQGLEGMAESSAARGAASSAAAAADAKWRAQFDRDSQQYGLDSMKSLYGMAPGEVDMYLGHNQSGRALNNQNQQGLLQTRFQNNKGPDWGKWAQVAGTTAMIAASDRNKKTDEQPMPGAFSDADLKMAKEPVSTDTIMAKFRALPISTWIYKADESRTRHIGPMAQDFQEIFGVGDGNTIALVYGMGLLMLLGKAVAEWKANL